MRRLWQQPDLWAFLIRLYRRTEQAELDRSLPVWRFLAFWRCFLRRLH